MVLPIVLASLALVTYFLTKPKSKEIKKDSNVLDQSNLTNPQSSGEKTVFEDSPEKQAELIKNISAEKLKKMSEKDLVKKIKNGSKNWRDWGFNETNEKYYREIERRNQLIKLPQTKKVGKVFRDDPNAISMMKTKIENKEKMVLYWKSIIKFPSRTYGNNLRGSLGDEKWYALTGASTEVREAKKKLEKLESDKKAGKTLERKATFTTGKKRFYYKESS